MDVGIRISLRSGTAWITRLVRCRFDTTYPVSRKRGVRRAPRYAMMGRGASSRLPRDDVWNNTVPARPRTLVEAPAISRNGIARRPHYRSPPARNKIVSRSSTSPAGLPAHVPSASGLRHCCGAGCPRPPEAAFPEGRSISSGDRNERDPGRAPYGPGPTLFCPEMRHAALRYAGDALDVFWSRVGDAPESILHSRIRLDGEWTEWREEGSQVVLEPERAWEGAG